MCGGPLEDLRIPFQPFLFHFSFISWNHLVFFTCYKVRFVKVGILSSLPFFHFSCLNHFSPVLCPISSSCKHLSCFGLHGLGPKGGIGVLAYIWPTTFSTSAPIHHHGDTFHFHLLVCAAWGSIPTSQGLVPVQGSILTNPGFHPHPRFHPHHPWSMTTLSLPPGGLLVGVVSMRGKGHWLGVGGSVRVYGSS